MADLSTVFTGIRFENPFLLASAPPTESESNIMRAFEAGWGGVVTKTIGLHPVVNVAGPKTKFLRIDNGGSRVSMAKRPDTALMASWNWELISDKPMDWWLPKLENIKRAWPNRVLVASIMAGSGNDKELGNWQTLVQGVQDAGADAIELNFSCPHMDRVDMGSNVGKDPVLCSVSTQAVKAVAKVPVWVKLTPATANIVDEARATFLGGADAIVSSNTFPSVPLVDPLTGEFEVNVDGFVSSGGMGGPAILPLSLAKMAEMTQKFPTPRVQTDDGNQDVVDLHAREDLLLDNYSWADRAQGKVRIPVERAMELIAQRGLPVAATVEQAPLLTGDEKPKVAVPLTSGFARTGYELDQAAAKKIDTGRPETHQ